jgi:uncharacterized zinc-type alcohol dehydrogenase-like protein
MSIQAMGLAGGRKRLAGSAIGGLPETQEMLDFCAEHGIVSDIEAIEVGQIEEAHARVQRNDIKYRCTSSSGTRSPVPRPVALTTDSLRHR